MAYELSAVWVSGNNRAFVLLERDRSRSVSLKRQTTPPVSDDKRIKDGSPDNDSTFIGDNEEIPTNDLNISELTEKLMNDN